jgi:hypothetical protein
VPRFSEKCNQRQNQTKRLLNDAISGTVLVSGTTYHP